MYSNGHAPTVGYLISMLNLYMKLTVSIKIAALPTNFEDFIKIGGPHLCPLKMTGQNCC